jgi:hypothetical protein
VRARRGRRPAFRLVVAIPSLCSETARSEGFRSSKIGTRWYVNAAAVRKCALGCARIHGELLKLGFMAAQSTVAKYMAKNGDPSGHGAPSCAIICRTSQ